MTKFKPNQWIKHVKTKRVYIVIGYGLIESDLKEVCIYKGHRTGDIWVRPVGEMHDGRFKVDGDD